MKSRYIVPARVVIGAVVFSGVVALTDIAAQAYVPFYAGAAYSDAAGGYRDTGGVTSIFPFPVEQMTSGVGANSRMVSAVNDAGVAVSLATLNYSPAGSSESEGVRAMRLTPSGVIEMDNLERGLPDFNGAAALDINASGVAVGQAYTYVASNPSFPLNHDNLVDSRPVRWNATGTMATELDSFNFNIDHMGRAYGAAYGVNATGTAVGFSEEGTGGWSAARWDAGGTAIRHLNGGTYASAYAINDAGVAVGYSSTVVQGGNPGGNRPVRWVPANVDANNNIEPSYLSPVVVDENGVGEGYAWDINNAGAAIGVSRASLGLRAVRWDANSTNPTILDILAPYRSDGLSANNFAYKINAGGTVVGIAEKYDNAGVSLGVRPARWAAGGHVVTELGLLGTGADGHAEGVANDINDSGVTVGQLIDYAGGTGQTAVYWGPNGAAVDLNRLIDPSLGWHLVEARHISNTGWITGWGSFDPTGTGFNSYNRTFLIHLPPTGDYNLNGIVDAADYAVWRGSLGSPTMLAADGDSDGDVDGDDYLIWKSHFGQTAPGSGAGTTATTAPEPCGLILMLLGLVPLCHRKQRSTLPRDPSQFVGSCLLPRLAGIRR